MESRSAGLESSVNQLGATTFAQRGRDHRISVGNRGSQRESWRQGASRHIALESQDPVMADPLSGRGGTTTLAAVPGDFPAPHRTWGCGLNTRESRCRATIEFWDPAMVDLRESTAAMARSGCLHLDTMSSAGSSSSPSSPLLSVEPTHKIQDATAAN
jgi:hypothetical protein